jgi:hypothetical protein
MAAATRRRRVQAPALRLDLGQGRRLAEPRHVRVARPLAENLAQFLRRLLAAVGGIDLLAAVEARRGRR